MKFIIKLSCILFCISNFSQKNMDTIYGNPKSIREEIVFLNEKKQNYKFMTDSDYGHAMIFTPKGIRNVFHSYWYDSQWVFYVNYYKEFLENGKPKNEIWYNKDKSFKRKYEYMYNDNRDLVEEKEIYYDNEYAITKYAYDYKGKIRSIVSVYSDETDMFTYQIFKHDSLGRLIKISNFDEEGYSRSDYRKYDRKNNLIKNFRHKPNKWRDNGDGSKSYISDSTGVWRTINKYEYDKNGDRILGLGFSKKTNKISRRIIYKYDNRKNLIEIINYYRNSDTTVYRINRLSYDENNLKIKEVQILSKDSLKIISKEYRYNVEGYISKFIHNEDNKKFEIDYIYQFDKKGNWIKITKIVNSEPLYVWTRKIEYF